MDASLLIYPLLGLIAGAAGAAAAILVLRRGNKPDEALQRQLAQLQTEIASRLERVTGDLRQDLTDRVSGSFEKMRTGVEVQLTEGRKEQAMRLDGAIKTLEGKFERLRESQAEGEARARKELSANLSANSEATAKQLEAIRGKVDEQLKELTKEVRGKLEQNLKEGFAQFEKVREHLAAAEEQLKQVGVLGTSINDLNALLKLPHLRGRFGEATLERLLHDFLPAHMVDLQTAAGTDGVGRADAVIHFPDHDLPIDSKFPREQIAGIFQSEDAAAQEEARKRLVEVVKVEARRISKYIDTDKGTTDIALMFLPSETLYMEVISHNDLTQALEDLKIFPVSPNTLLMALRSIALVYKWYQVAARFEETRTLLGRANRSFEHFSKHFDTIGKSLDRAQQAYSTATTHLTHYRNRVTEITGEEPEQLEEGTEE